MADYTPLTNLRGPAARITSVSAETIGWDEPADVVMTGPDQNREFDFKIPMPLPGPETVNNDDATELLLKNPTKTSAAVKTVALGIKKKKFGGVVPEPVRAPTLVVDAAWPDRNVAYRIVWSENNGQTLYGYGADRSWRKSTDGGKTWVYRGLMGQGLSEVGVFLKLASGTLLAMIPGSTAGIVRSADDGATWAWAFNTTTAPPSRLSTWAMGAQSWAQDPITGAIYYGEYDISNDKALTHVYRSVDDGATWQIFHSFPGFASGSADKVRHVHSIQWDHVMQRIIIMTGDSDPAAGMYRVKADNTGAEPMLLNRDVPSILDGARAIGLIPFPDYLCWTGDSTGNPWLMRIARSEIGNPNPVVERVYRVNSTAWFTCRASDDGSRWVFSASNEAGSRIDRSAHLYAVEDQGATVYEVGALSIPRSAGGLPAIAPVGQAHIHGDTMLLQAHSAGKSAVWRGSISDGVAQLPWPAPDPDAYLIESVNSGAVDFSPGTVSNVFASSRAPYFARKLHIFEMGCIAQTGTATGLAVAVRRKSDGSIIMNSAVASERAQRRAEAGGPIFSILIDAATDIEFVVYATSGTARVTATVTYGWGS